MLKEAIYCYSVSGKYIKKYNSMTQACQAVGVNNGAISSVLRRGRRFCAGYQWHKEYSPNIGKDSRYGLAKCIECGIEFEKNKVYHEVCSDICRVKRAHFKRFKTEYKQRDHTAICLNHKCRKEFSPENINQKYCSRNCWQFIYRCKKRSEKSLTCAFCGCDFVATKTLREKYCSAECSTNARERYMMAYSGEYYAGNKWRFKIDARKRREQYNQNKDKFRYALRKMRSSLPDSYIKTMLIANTMISRDAINKDLVDAKRIQVKIKRLIKNKTTTL